MPWKLLREAGHEVVFATEAGATPACDPLLITGVVFGKLGARPEAIAFYREMEQAPEFVAPPAVERLPRRRARRAVPRRRPRARDAAVPRQRRRAADRRGVLRDRRSRSRRSATACWSRRGRRRADGHSVLHGHRTTCLPKYMERAAFLVDVLAARPLLPHVSGVRRGRGARGARAAGGLRARPARAVEARYARGRHAARSSSRTAATCRRAGRVTRISSRRS